MISDKGEGACKTVARTWKISRACHELFLSVVLSAMQIEENFNRLKADLIDKLVIVTGTFVDQLKARTYTKVNPKMALSRIFLQGSRLPARLNVS